MSFRCSNWEFIHLSSFCFLNPFSFTLFLYENKVLKSCKAEFNTTFISNMHLLLCFVLDPWVDNEVFSFPPAEPKTRGRRRSCRTDESKREGVREREGQKMKRRRIRGRVIFVEGKIRVSSWLVSRRVCASESTQFMFHFVRLQQNS